MRLAMLGACLLVVMSGCGGSDSKSSSGSSGGAGGISFESGGSGSGDLVTGLPNTTDGGLAGAAGSDLVSDTVAGAGAAAGGAGGVAQNDAGQQGSVDQTAAAGGSGAGDAAGPTQGYEAGVTGSEAMALLASDEQAQAVCKKAGEEVSTNNVDKWVSGACALQGVVQEEQGNGTCEDVQKACTSTTPGSTKCTKAQFADCVVTADAYVACVKALAAASVTAYANFDCNTPSSQFTAPATPAVCTDVISKCPDLQN
jgi:hypothetical protein